MTDSTWKPRWPQKVYPQWCYLCDEKQSWGLGTCWNVKCKLYKNTAKKGAPSNSAAGSATAEAIASAPGSSAAGAGLLEELQAVLATPSEGEPTAGVLGQQPGPRSTSYGGRCI